jgi:DNA polymerase delta subunit 1
LQDFEKLVITYDPDFIVGYNMVNFDLKYLIERAKMLKIHNYGHFGKNLKQRSEVRTGKLQSKAMGMR